MNRKMLITGVSGQDSSYVVEFLLPNARELMGIRRCGSLDMERIEHLYLGANRDRRDR